MAGIADRRLAGVEHPPAEGEPEMNTNLIYELARVAIDAASKDWRFAAGLMTAGLLVGLGTAIWRKRSKQSDGDVARRDRH